MELAKSCVACGSVSLASSAAILMPFVADRALGWGPVTIGPEWQLQTIPAGYACTRVSSLLCRACGHLFMDLRFGAAEMENLYAGYRGAEYLALRETYEPGYSVQNARFHRQIAYLAQIESLLAPHLPDSPAVLDWGGDSGINTPFRSCSRLCHVFDISGVDTMEGATAITAEQLRSERYDLIVLSHVLEHVPWPLDLLEEVKGAMSADTLLYVEVPYEQLMQGEGTDDARLTSKRHWHEHINFFSITSLDALLSRAGLTVLQLVDTPAADTIPGAVLQAICGLPEANS